MLAKMYSEDKLRQGEVFLSESIIGTRFFASVVEETLVGTIPGVVCEVEGSAFITGFHTFVVDPKDPLRDGFVL
jgi:proline racemase